MKVSTVALVIRSEGAVPALVDTFSDDREINLLESLFYARDPEPLQTVYDQRAQQVKEEEEFGDYIEDLLSQPFVRPEIQEHGTQWLKSKIRVEQYQRSEAEAAKIIADYAFKVFLEDRSRTDFFLAGPSTQVRIRVFVIDSEKDRGMTPSRAA